MGHARDLARPSCKKALTLPALPTWHARLPAAANEHATAIGINGGEGEQNTTNPACLEWSGSTLRCAASASWAILDGVTMP